MKFGVVEVTSSEDETICHATTDDVRLRGVVWTWNTAAGVVEYGLKHHPVGYFALSPPMIEPMAKVLAAHLAELYGDDDEVEAVRDEVARG